jgi:hypothetical protein
MGHFFYGTVVGFLLSFCALVSVAAWLRLRGRQRWRIAIQVSVTLAAILVAVSVLALISRVWFPFPEPEWLSKHLLPTKYVQILLGGTLGILVPLWLMRQLIAYYRGTGDAQQAEHDEPEDQKAAKKKEQEPGRSEWNWTIGFVAILVVAVLLPYLEDMIRQATSIKIGTVEVTVKVEQKAQLLTEFARDRLSPYLSVVEEPADLEKRIASDNRRYDKSVRTVREPANKEFQKFYAGLLYPFLSCTKVLFDKGWPSESVNGSIRLLVNEWFAMATNGASALGTTAHIKKMAAIAEGEIAKWADAEPACGKLHVRVADVGPQIQESFHFYWFLSHLLRALDERFSAIQNLERVGSWARNSELNWAVLIAALYYEEDPTLEKAIEYSELGLKMAANGLDAAKRRQSEEKVVCPEDRKLWKKAHEVCYDLARFSGSLRQRKNNVAYTHAQSGRSDLSRARELAREVLRTAAEEGGPDLSRNTEHWSALDTYAYVIMVDAAQKSDPDDAKLIACAELTFKALARKAADKFSDMTKAPNDPGFRSDFLEARRSVDIYNAHRALAASLLKQTRAMQCSVNDKEYKDMQEGRL